MMMLHNIARPSADRFNDESAQAPASPADLGASIVRIDTPDAFDDCDVALPEPAPLLRTATPAARETSPVLRTPTPVSAESAPAFAFNELPDALVSDDMQSMVITPLDGGIAVVSLSVSFGVACYMMDGTHALPTAGAFVLAAGVAAAHMHGTQTPYTERYGSLSPAGVVTMAAGCFACGVTLWGIRSLV